MDPTLVKHIAIQWMASRNILDAWMNLILFHAAETAYVQKLEYLDKKDNLKYFFAVLPHWRCELEEMDFWGEQSDAWQLYLKHLNKGNKYV